MAPTPPNFAGQNANIPRAAHAEHIQSSLDGGNQQQKLQALRNRIHQLEAANTELRQIRNMTAVHLQNIISEKSDLLAAHTGLVDTYTSYVASSSLILAQLEKTNDAMDKLQNALALKDKQIDDLLAENAAVRAASDAAEDAFREALAKKDKQFADATALHGEYHRRLTEQADRMWGERIQSAQAVEEVEVDEAQVNTYLEKKEALRSFLTDQS